MSHLTRMHYRTTVVRRVLDDGAERLYCNTFFNLSPFLIISLQSSIASLFLPEPLLSSYVSLYSTVPSSPPKKSHAYSNSCRFVLSTCAHITQLPGSLGSIELKSSKFSFATDMDCGVTWRKQGKYSLPTNIQVGPVFYLARYPSGVNA